MLQLKTANVKVDEIFSDAHVDGLSVLIACPIVTLCRGEMWGRLSLA